MSLRRRLCAAALVLLGCGESAPEATYYLPMQASVEDWDLMAPGFDLVASSLTPQ